VLNPRAQSCAEKLKKQQSTWRLREEIMQMKQSPMGGDHTRHLWILAKFPSEPHNWEKRLQHIQSKANAQRLGELHGDFNICPILGR
jgi:hypothetical protein